MSSNLAKALATCGVVFAVASGCTGQPPANDPPKETAVLNDLTQKQATAGVDKYFQLVSGHLPPGAQLAPLEKGTGTVNCHTPDGNERTGQVFVTANWSVEGLDPAVEASMVDQLRATWLGEGYKLIEDPRFENGDEVPTFATPGDDYHLTIWRYGDHRSTPLIIIESPCAWPEPMPTTSQSG